MAILVTYASKHGATQEIAERIADRLRASGAEVEMYPVKSAGDLAGYDAFVIGSAVFYGSWMKEATSFVMRNRSVLAGQPVWLFSSGPLGTDTTDAEGNDLLEVAEPKQIAELKEVVQPRDHRVFFGALRRSTLGFAERVVSALPAGRDLLPEGDFRDWADIDAWADHIAVELGYAPVPNY